MKFKALALMLVVAAIATVAAALEQDPRGVKPIQSISGRRLALVIGNDAYPRMALRNAGSDAKAVAKALDTYGFHVDIALDATYKELNKEVDRFVAQLRAGDVAMVYYAGHGIQVDNENYLVPIDFAAQDEADVKYESYPASRIADRIARAGASLTILVLDACRNNPFRSSRSGSSGLAPMDTATGTLIAFATAPNRTADDNPRGPNGLFTTYLLEAMDQPALGIEEVFSHARQRVYEASEKKQVPWLVSSVIGQFHFRRAAAAAPSGGSPATPPAVNAEANPRSFASGMSGLMLHQIRPDKTADFEAVMRRLKEGLAGSSKPGRRLQALGWRVFRATEPTGGNTLYVSVIDPAVAGLNYEVTTILSEAFPEEIMSLYATFAAAYAQKSENILHLRPIAYMAPASVATPTARATAAPAAPVSTTYSLSSDAGLSIHFIKPDKTADFEAVMAKVREALGASANPARRAQGLGWRVFRAEEPSPTGEAMYVWTIDPAVKGTDYQVTAILAEGLPDDAQRLSRLYVDAYSSSTTKLTWVNLKLVVDLGSR